MQLRFRHDEQDWDVTVEPDGDAWRLHVDGAEVRLAAHPGADGSWLVDTPAGRRRAWVAVRGAERLVFLDGEVVRLKLPDPAADDADEADVAGPVLRARMPGKVIRVLAAAGDVVAAGQPLLIMESMKMETELSAGVAGTVGEVAVAEGQVVAQDELLLTIVPAAAE